MADIEISNFAELVPFEEGVCPDCGDYSTIYDVTGWCWSCTIFHHPELALCNECNQPFNIKKQQNNTCGRCRYSAFVTKNADKINQLMQEGHTKTQAIKLVRGGIVCLSCGRPIRAGKRGKSFFCIRCPKQAQKYTRLMVKKSRSRREVLRLLNEEFNLQYYREDLEIEE